MYDAPTKELVDDLLPKTPGNIELIVDVVVPGVSCIGLSYVSVKLV